MRLHGQAVKTSPFHGGNPGSIPGGVTKKKDGYNFVSVFFLADSRRETDAEQHSPSPLYPVSSDAFVLAELCDTHAICRFSRIDLLSQSPGGVTKKGTRNWVPFLVTPPFISPVFKVLSLRSDPLPAARDRV